MFGVQGVQRYCGGEDDDQSSCAYKIMMFSRGQSSFRRDLAESTKTCAETTSLRTMSSQRIFQAIGTMIPSTHTNTTMMPGNCGASKRKYNATRTTNPAMPTRR